MLFTEGKTDAEALSEAAYRSEHIERRINELSAALSAINLGRAVPQLTVVSNVAIQGVAHTTVNLGILPDTARQFFRAALDEAVIRKIEIDVKLAAARKALEE